MYLCIVTRGTAATANNFEHAFQFEKRHAWQKRGTDLVF